MGILPCGMALTHVMATAEGNVDFTIGEHTSEFAGILVGE